MGFDELRDNIIEQGLTETETHLKILLEILVHESMQIGERGHTDVPNFIFSDSRFKSRFPVSSYRLEDSGYRRTFSRNKDYLLDNRLIETVPVNWPDDYKRRGTYYNTTPLGKVLAMKYWYKKNEPREIKMKMGRMVKIVDFKPTELLNSFFEYLPKLKQYSKTIKESSTELELNDALKYAFPEIDINFRGVTKKQTQFGLLGSWKLVRPCRRCFKQTIFWKQGRSSTKN